jgi:serine beta-lactamase-like protein LACTB
VSKSRNLTWPALIVLAVGVMVAAVLGRFLYVDATRAPIHPDPETVPSMRRSSPPEKWADMVRQGREVVVTALAGQNLPGLSVAVGIRNEGPGEEIIWAEGFGWANHEDRVPVSPDTRFRITGLSIPLTSAAVGLLLEQRQLDLDERIQTYVPAFPEKPWPVTLRHALGHMAGLRNDGGDEVPLPESCERAADALPRFADRPLLFAPGSRFDFASYGWILVSAVVEAEVEEPFFTFMRRRVFEPLGMIATTPDFAREPMPDRTTFYFPRFAAEPRYGPELAQEGDYSCFAGAGGFLSTPSDLVRFGTALYGSKLLQPATVALLQTPQRLEAGLETSYGLGWQLDRLAIGGESVRVAGHDGKFGMGGSASLLTLPERGLAVAVTTNISYANTRAVAVAIAQIFAAPAPR